MLVDCTLKERTLMRPPKRFIMLITMLLCTAIPSYALARQTGEVIPPGGHPKARSEHHAPPQGVPDYYEITPFGYFHPSCVRMTHNKDKILSDGSVLHADGSMEPASQCTYPHYSASGKRFEPSQMSIPPRKPQNSGVLPSAQAALPSPDFNGYILEVSGFSNSLPGINSFSSSWVVPPSPSMYDGQTVYLWPGVFPTDNTTGETLSVLQPVMGFGADLGNAWSIASWNCCPGNAVWESSPLMVEPGDTITGTAYTPNGGSEWIIAASATPPNSGQTYTTILDAATPNTSVQGFDGAVLETYNIDNCAEFPPASVTFNNSIYNTPSGYYTSGWEYNEGDTVIPGMINCNYAVSLGTPPNQNYQAPITLSWTTTPVTKAPPAPTGVTAAVANYFGNAIVQVVWNGIISASGYNVKRAVGAGSYTTVATGVEGFYSDSSVTNGTTYYYKISATNAIGESPNSSPVSATPGIINIVSPSGGQTLLPGSSFTIQWTAQGLPAGSQIALTLNNPATFVQNYVIAQGLAPTATSYAWKVPLTGIAPGNYSIRVVNINADGSNGVSAYSMPVTIPPANGLTATSGNNGIVLWWSPVAANSYHIKRALLPGGPYSVIATVPATILTFTDNYFNDAQGVTYGRTYYYVVSSINSTGFENPNSNQVSAVFSVPLPSTPAGLQATGQLSQAALAWNTSTNTTYYLVSRATVSGGPYTVIGNPNANTFTDCSSTTCTAPDSAPVNGTTYYYVLSASGPGGQSGSSAQVSAKPGRPHAHATVTPGSGNANVTNFQFDGSSSTDPSGTITSYAWDFGDNTTGSGITTSHVYLGAGSFSPVLTVTDNRYITGSYTLPAITVTSVPPLAPQGVTASSGSNGIVLTWNASIGATSYNVKRATVSGGPYTTVYQDPFGDGTFTDNYINDSYGVTYGTTYYYVVSAVNSAGESPNSSQVSAKFAVLPPVVPVLTATAGNAQVTLGWGADSNSAIDYVFRSTVSGGPYTVIGISRTTTFHDPADDYPGVSTPVNGTAYYYYAYALGPGGQSANSVQVSATPHT